MTSLLVFKERLKEFYVKFGAYINPVIRFCFSLLTFFLMNHSVGFSSQLTRTYVPFALAAICAFLPYGAIAFIAGVCLLIHLWGVSLEITMVTAVFFLVVGLLYYGFQPGDGYLLLLTPVLFLLKIPYAVPLLAGLSGSVLSVIPVSCGVVIYYIIIYVKQNAGVLTNELSPDIMQRFIQVVNGLFATKEIVMMMAAFAAALLIVILIKNLSIDYSWIIAIVAGTIVELAVIFVGDITADITVPVLELIIGIMVSLVVAAVYTFFVFAVDYSRTEYVQFEDDDYYYYVKAVPKLTVSRPDVKVQKINTRKLQKPQR
ncbi:MAG TPA: ABC transporter permease [Candidatus Hungatella pullicola]|nr:ABC transporter permease [Candidatus Hungatella pullicola]